MEKTTATKLKVGIEATFPFGEKTKKGTILEVVRAGHVPTAKKFAGLKFNGTINSNEKTIVMKSGKNQFLWIPANHVNV